MSREDRVILEMAIEALIAVLDLMDGDPDFEDGDPSEENGDLEPSLAHLTNGGCCYSREHDLEENEAWAA